MEKKDIEHLATLARIKLTESEVDELTTDISSILGYVGEINKITADATLEKKVGALNTIMRDDGDPHEPGIYTEDLLKSAPRRKGQYIEVKKILDNGS